MEQDEINDPYIREHRKNHVSPIGLGMPNWLLLNQFGAMVQSAFVYYPFLVGSALITKTPRDIDIRLILPDSNFESLYGKDLNKHLTGWATTCIVWSAYGTQMVGKPVDFQIVPWSHVQAYKAFPKLMIGYQESHD